MPTAADDCLPAWARSGGNPPLQGRIRQQAADFAVTEILDIDFSGDGEHDYLFVEKTGLNTEFVARALARHAGTPAKDTGYAGLKDRHAVTRQWFSVRRNPAGPADWQAFDLDGASILETCRHARKLKRGAHSHNRFRIVVATLSGDRDVAAARLSAVRTGGVPNYFGEQRFGRRAGNLELARALFAGRRLARDKRSIALSAARSFIFNDILNARVRDGNWAKALPGEALNLDGSNSYFIMADDDASIAGRLASGDVHPTAALWGRGALPEGAAYDRAGADRHSDLARGLESAGLAMARRATRMNVADLCWEFDENQLVLEFRLRRGGFATALLRELVTLSS